MRKLGRETSRGERRINMKRASRGESRGESTFQSRCEYRYNSGIRAEMRAAQVLEKKE
jgi:hypothetical protein